MKQFIKTYSTMIDIELVDHIQITKNTESDDYSVIAYYYDKNEKIKWLKMHEGSEIECGHVLGDIYDQARKYERVLEMFNKLERGK